MKIPLPPSTGIDVLDHWLELLINLISRGLTFSNGGSESTIEHDGTNLNIDAEGVGTRFGSGIAINGVPGARPIAAYVPSGNFNDALGIFGTIAPSGDIVNWSAFNLSAGLTGAWNIASYSGVYFAPAMVSFAGIINHFSGFNFIPAWSAGTATNVYGFRYNPTKTTGTWTHVYGIKIEDVDQGGTSNHAIYTGTGLNHLGDDVEAVGTYRTTTSLYRRYYHLPLGSFDPGASGATWTDGDANTVGGWQLNAAGEELHGVVDVHADWDGASDLELEVYFEINTASAENDTVDIKAEFLYKGVGESVTKSQTVEVATNVGDGGIKAQYTMFKAEFVINWDEVDNVIEAGDIVHIHLNLETDTSEVDDIIITNIAFHYDTTHVGIESGDT